MYRVKYKEDDGWSAFNPSPRTEDVETFWDEEKDARREFNAVKDHINNSEKYSEVQLHELEVNNSQSDHKLLDSYDNYQTFDISENFNFGHG